MSTRTVREYLRVSKDARVTGRSPDQQHTENVRAIIEQGWALHPAPAYRDTNRSASRYAKLVREDFKRLIEDLETGNFGADVLAIWESSRGSRRVGEWVDLVDLCRQRNVLIWVTTHGRAYDPNRSRDRRSLLEDAVDAEYESDKISERRKRSARASAAEGRPHGKNIYGYRRVYDEGTRDLLRVEPRPEQARVVIEAAHRVLAREPFYAIAKDFNERGIPTRRAKRNPPFENEAWTPSTVKQMLRLPAYAGKRDYCGSIVGDAMWPALIPFEQWQQLQAIMDAPSRKGPRDHMGRYLLSGIALCGVCGAPLKSQKHTYIPRRANADGAPQPRHTYRSYICPGIPGVRRPAGTPNWHAGMRMNLLDEIVIDQLLQHVRDSTIPSHHEGTDEKAWAMRLDLLKEIAEHEHYLDTVRAQAAAARRFELALDQQTRVQPFIDAARRKIADLTTPNPLVRALSDAPDSRQAWDALELPEQRRLVRGIMTPVLQRIKPSERGSNRPVPDRVEIIWR